MIVETRNGFLEGEYKEGLYSFKGIPYASPPLGDKRFSAPEPVESWGGVRSARHCGSVCPQISKIMIQGETENEDCLYLNVMTPAADNGKRAVMIWIHGGIFALGSGSSRVYRGNDFVRKENIVFVTLNYRLGPLGFLCFDDLKGHEPGFDDNLGIRDQVAAIEWVRENIAAFGGDPDNITLWGQSAGATSVLTLLTLPSLQGKIKGAIAQSPSHHSLWSREEAIWNTRRFLAKLGVDEHDLTPLKTMPVHKIIRVAKLLFRKGEPLATRSFVPAFGTPFVPLSIERYFETSQAPPLLTGFTDRESTLFTTKRIGLMTLEKEAYEKILIQMHPETREKILGEYEQLNSQRKIEEMITDVVWHIPTIQLAEQIGKKSDVWMYNISWTSRLMRWMGIGPFHGIDLLLHFNMLSNRLLLSLLHGLHLNSSKRLGKRMRKHWGNFARKQNPNGEGLTEWLAYQADEKRQVLNFNNSISLLTDPYQKKRILWKSINPRMVLEGMQKEEENRARKVLKTE